MGFLNLLLDVAAVSLWLSWRGFGTTPIRRPAGTLGSNLRPVDVSTPRRWLQLVGFAALVVGRAFLYFQIGDGTNWVALWSPGAVTIAFRSDDFSRMLLFSALSAATAIIIGYSWLIASAALGSAAKDPDAITRALRSELKWVARVPFGLGILVPMLFAATLWFLTGPLIRRVAHGPPSETFKTLVEQALVVGLGILPSLRIPFLAMVLVRGLAEFVFFGRHPFWIFVEQNGERLCRPFSWLRVGRLNFAPLVTLLAIWLLGRTLGFGFNDFKGGISERARWLGVGLIPWLFERIPQ